MHHATFDMHHVLQPYPSCPEEEHHIRGKEGIGLIYFNSKYAVGIITSMTYSTARIRLRLWGHGYGVWGVQNWALI